MTSFTKKQQSDLLCGIAHDSEITVNTTIDLTTNDRINDKASVRDTCSAKSIDDVSNKTGSTIKVSPNHVSPSPEEGSPDYISPSSQTSISIYISSKKRLPSGFGSIRYLGKGRRNSYAVHPPSVSVKFHVTIFSRSIPL